LFQIATEHIAPAETTRILYLRPKINLLAAKTVTVPTTIPPKILIAGPDSNVLAGPINDIRFQLGVGVQKGITASSKSGHGNFGHALFAKETIITRETKPKKVNKLTKKDVPLTTPNEISTGFNSHPNKNEYCGTKS
jgi:hypothetical protein